jgi:mannose-1-phosphate guanylyltransferase
VHLVGQERVLVATRREFLSIVQQQLPGFPRANCLLEPVGRDTAACIGLAALAVETRLPGARMLVTPSDHFIEPFHAFEETIRQGVQLLDRVDGLVTLGIPPTGPETGYGYILAGEAVAAHPAARRCDRFTEKPDRTTAERFVADGRYYWNSGIFLWQAATLLKAVAQHLPEHWRALEEIRPALGGPGEAEVLDRVFPRMPRVSVDVGILERAHDVYMIPATFGWDDVGAWSALGRILPQDDSWERRGRSHTVGTAMVCVCADDQNRWERSGSETSWWWRPRGDLVCPRAGARVKDLVRAMRERRPVRARPPPPPPPRSPPCPLNPAPW